MTGMANPPTAAEVESKLTGPHWSKGDALSNRDMRKAYCGRMIFGTQPFKDAGAVCRECVQKWQEYSSIGE